MPLVHDVIIDDAAFTMLVYLHRPNLTLTAQVSVMELLGGKTVTGFSLGSITRSEKGLEVGKAVMDLLEQKVIQPLTGILKCFAPMRILIINLLSVQMLRQIEQMMHLEHPQIFGEDRISAAEVSAVLCSSRRRASACIVRDSEQVQKTSFDAR